MRFKVSKKPANSYQHGNLREALVQAGLKLLAEGGVQGLSLRAAAQLAGVSHAAPYRHFKDKDALVAAIAEQGFRLLSASMREQIAHDQPANTRERLRAVGKGYVHFGLAYPAHLQVIFGGVLAEDRATPELRQAGAEAYHMLRDCVAEGLAAGEFRGGDADTVSLAAWSLVHGLCHLLITRAIPSRPKDAQADAIAAALIELLGTGIQAKRT